MTPAEAGRVLALAAAYDNRQAGQAAVVAHYRDSRDWVMPADVNRRCRALRAERIRAAGHLPGPQDLVDDPAAWRAIGRTPPPALPETRRRRLTPETKHSD